MQLSKCLIARINLIYRSIHSEVSHFIKKQ